MRFFFLILVRLEGLFINFVSFGRDARSASFSYFVSFGRDAYSTSFSNPASFYL